jgi:prepilin-type N-terminal cleavage/methylation domain-containing protein
MKLKAGEKGFTLIELVVGISIAAFVVGAASMTISTMMRLTPKNNDWAIALRQVQNTGYWISQDVKMSQGTIGIDPVPNTFLTLALPYDAGGTIATKTVTYQLENLSGREWLTRTDNVVGKRAIAESISDISATYSQHCTDNCTLTFTITAVSGNVPVTRQYEASQRVPSP